MLTCLISQCSIAHTFSVPVKLNDTHSLEMLYALSFHLCYFTKLKHPAPPSPSNKSPPSIKILLKPCLFPGADHPTISISVFSNESALRIRWPNYWSFSFNSSPANEHSGLISFRMDWLDLLTVQGTLKSLLHSSKASILWCSAFLTVQLSHPYMTTGKTIALTRQIFVGKVMSLLLNILSNFPSKE